MPKTTQGNVLPSMNSRMLVMSNNKPPRKMMGPLISMVKLSLIMRLEWTLRERNAIPTGASPGHQTARNRGCGNNKATEASNIEEAIVSQFFRSISGCAWVNRFLWYLQGSRITNSLGKFGLAPGHRSQVELLELLWRQSHRGRDGGQCMPCSFSVLAVVAVHFV